MNKLNKESALILIASFIGASFSIGIDKLFQGYSNIGNWVGFTILVIVLFILTKFLLKPYVK